MDLALPQQNNTAPANASEGAPSTSGNSGQRAFLPACRNCDEYLVVFGTTNCGRTSCWTLIRRCRSRPAIARRQVAMMAHQLQVMLHTACDHNASCNVRGNSCLLRRGPVLISIPSQTDNIVVTLLPAGAASARAALKAEFEASAPLEDVRSSCCRC